MPCSWGLGRGREERDSHHTMFTFDYKSRENSPFSSRGGRPATTIFSPSHILLIFSSEPPLNLRPSNIVLIMKLIRNSRPVSSFLACHTQLSFVSGEGGKRPTPVLPSSRIYRHKTGLATCRPTLTSFACRQIFLICIC